MPWPMEIGYSATKHAVVGLSTSLRAEASHAGVRVSALCPGLVRTPIIHGGKYGRWIRNYPIEKVTELMESTKPIPLDKFIPVALKQISRNKAIIVIPGFYRVLWRMYRVWPSFGIGLSRRLFQGMRKQLAEFEIKP